MVRLILLILICPIFTQSKAQTYYPFPDSNAVWNFHYQMFCNMSGGVTNAYYSVVFSGDTIINNSFYKKLNVPAIDIQMNGSCIVPDGGYKGAIRQDTSAKKVFIIAPNDSLEQLLYDFTLEVGDTVQGYIERNAWIPDVILDIDSVLVGNAHRKRWHINWGYSIYIIEGIGSTYGLIEASPGESVVDLWNYYLTCFKQDNQTLYPDTATSCDIITVSVDEKENINYGFTIYPNPVSDELHISFKPGITSEVEIHILNILGKVERKFNINNIEKDNVEKLKTEYLPSGLYFIRVNIDGSTVTKKFIKL